MRNLASGNKINFTVFTFLIMTILVILICAVVIVLGYDKSEYQITNSAFIYDIDYNYIDLENPATIFQKWTGNYYLKENITNKEYKLGKYAISFDTLTNSVDLFGGFYEVSRGGNINKISGYNTINSSSEDKFYKIDDRKYLIIARDIENNTGSLSTENYLIIIIDKLGNALLLNNQINAKTINEMTIKTKSYEFDVANEVLRFNDEQQINLKKILGSTNEYTPPTNTVNNEIDENTVEADNVIIANGGSSTTTTTTTNNSTTIVQNGVGNSNITGNNQGNKEEDKTWVDSLNKWIGDVSNAFESSYNKEQNKDKNDKDNSSINRSVALNSLDVGTTTMDINYTINDPENKYNVVYVSVSNGKDNKIISLDKSSNKYKLTDLNPDTNYTVEIGHKIIYSDATSKDTIEDSMTARTLRPSESITVTKISLDRIYYTLKLDSTFVYDSGAKIKIYTDDGEEQSLAVTLNNSDLEKAASSGYTGSFKIPSLFKEAKGASIRILLEDTKYSGRTIKTDVKTKIINY